MVFIRNLVVAFSLYSKIPMPHFEWKEEDMKYNLAFLPLVGAVIGAIEYLLIRKAFRFNLPMVAVMAFAGLVPLIVTGGFHLDGFMDTQDAFKSYKSPEEKLKILEDPHIGAFAVISLLSYVLVWTGALSIMIWRFSDTGVIFFCMSFVVSRIMTGLCSLSFEKAKKDGMLSTETKSAGKGCKYALIAELLVCAAFLLYVNAALTVLLALSTALFTAYYYRKTKREFGGVTGDTAGYYLVFTEGLMVALLALFLSLPLG